MEYIIITYILTIILSLIVKLTNNLTLIKDIFNTGYKFNIKDLSQLKKEFKSIFPQNSIMFSLIPIFNLIQNLSNTLTYEDQKHKLLDCLETIDILEKMTKDELNTYSKHPNALNALYMSFKTTNQKSSPIVTPPEHTSPSPNKTSQNQISKYSYTNKQEPTISSKKQFLIHILSEILTDEEIDKLKETKTLTKKKTK